MTEVRINRVAAGDVGKRPVETAFCDVQIDGIHTTKVYLWQWLRRALPNQRDQYARHYDDHDSSDEDVHSMKSRLALQRTHLNDWYWPARANRADDLALNR